MATITAKLFIRASHPYPLSSADRPRSLKRYLIGGILITDGDLPVETVVSGDGHVVEKGSIDVMAMMFGDGAVSAGSIELKFRLDTAVEHKCEGWRMDQVLTGIDWNKRPNE